MGIRKDLTGMEFGRLYVVGYYGKAKSGHSMWTCKCSCGNAKAIVGNSLLKGSTKSCGCLTKELNVSNPNRTTHRLHGTRLYRIWKAMKTRCYNRNGKDWEQYGGKGIYVCEEWENDFQLFYDWSIANGYSDELTIDRIDYNGNYGPSNCRWASLRTQANNKGNNHIVIVDNISHTVSDWCCALDIKKSSLYYFSKKDNISIDEIIKKTYHERR